MFSRRSFQLLPALGAAGLFIAAGTAIDAQNLFVPNGSFESPETDFAGPSMGSWQKAPEPFWYIDPTGMFPWAAVMGQFLNPTNGAADHIDNMEGRQGAYLFALPEVAISQDAPPTTDGAAPAQLLHAQFAVGRTYTLTVGVLGGGGGMSNGVPLVLSLYYRDHSGHMVTVASTSITNTPQLFPTNTHLTDFQVHVPAVKPSDDWAGKRIGIKLASGLTLADSALAGGYWDVDNVRLTESVVPNASFESPSNDFASPSMDSWQKAPEPFWYVDSTGMFPWPALMGQFLNTTNGSADHLTNIDGRQAAYLFALPDVAIFQDENLTDGENGVGTNEFGARFEVGKSYALTVALLGGGGGMSNGVPFSISLYYRDVAGTPVTVATTFVTNTSALFPTNTAFADFQVRVPQVQAADAWAGRFIGVRLASALGLADSPIFGGYWIVDNVRLTESVLPNSSFETPETELASPSSGSWQKAPEPAWYVDDTGMFPWPALAGQFANTTNGSADHIENMDGEQAAYLFALPDVAIFQDGISTAGQLALRFERGKAYDLTVGVLGGGGGMSNGVPLILSFYYRDAASNQVTIAATSVTNRPGLFPTNNHFTDFQVRVPTIRGDEPWAGKLVGVRIASGLTLADSAMFGGYWDLDHVRVNVVRDPVLTKMSHGDGGVFQFSLTGAPGRYEVLASPDVTSPSSAWTSLGVFTNVTGEVLISDPGAALRFYQGRSSP